MDDHSVGRRALQLLFEFVIINAMADGGVAPAVWRHHLNTNERSSAPVSRDRLLDHCIAPLLAFLALLNPTPVKVHRIVGVQMSELN